MTISEFFDEYNVEHLAAYNYLDEHGHWPEGFLPDDLEFDGTWHHTISYRMAKAYVKLGVTGQIFGMPSIDQ